MNNPPTKQQIRRSCLSEIDQELDEMLINITTETKLRIRNIKSLRDEVSKTL